MSNSRDQERAMRRCEYVDPITGLRCKNIPRRYRSYCRLCSVKRSRLERRRGQAKHYPDLLIPAVMLTPRAKSLLPETLQSECIRFVSAVCRKVIVTQVVLYGSYAQERAHAWSDIDLAVLSHEFTGHSLTRRAILLRYMCLDAGTPEVQAIGLTPHEFDHGDYPRILSSIRNGIPLLKEMEVMQWQTNQLVV
jgi:hypothetical protein